MSPDQTLAYLAARGEQCPFCKTGDVEEADVGLDEIDGVDVRRGMAYQRMACLQCGREWVDEYTLTNVYTPEEYPGDRDH